MNAATPSRERAIGREVLRDELLAEALEAFAETDARTISNAADFLLHRVLLEWKWLAWTPGGYVAGPHLLAHRHAREPETEGLACVVPLARPDLGGDAR